MILAEQYYDISEDGILRNVNIQQAIIDNQNYGLFELVVPSSVCRLDSFCISLDFHQQITNIVIPEGVSVIPGYFLNGGWNLRSISLPSTIRRIEKSAFYNCNQLEKIVFPDGLEYIGRSAFALCKNLKKIVFPDSIIELDVYAFEECTGLTSVQLPKNVAIIGSHAFRNTVTHDMLTEQSGCYYLRTADNPYYMLYEADKSIECYEIHQNTRIINSDVFSWNKNLKKVSLPKKLISIGRDAFWHCENLTRITIPDSVIAIGERVFANSGIKTASFGKRIKYIPTASFDCPISKINYRGNIQGFLSVIKQYGWVEPYRIIEIYCHDAVLIKDKRNTSRYKYKKMFDD